MLGIRKPWEGKELCNILHPAILFLGIYPVGILSRTHTVCVTRLAISAWFVIANIRNNLSFHQERAG